MGVNSLPKTVNRQRRGCDLNPGPSAPESCTLTTRLPSHPESASVTQIRERGASTYSVQLVAVIAVNMVCHKPATAAAAAVVTPLTPPPRRLDDGRFDRRP